jgi:hypothetical protein
MSRHNNLGPRLGRMPEYVMRATLAMNEPPLGEQSLANTPAISFDFRHPDHSRSRAHIFAQSFSKNKRPAP